MIFWALIFAPATIAQHYQYLFDQANTLYQQEKYQQAIDKYLEIVKNGYASWQLYYNLGNAYYKTQDFGRAILNYERALKLNPKNEDIKFNLELANLTVVDKIVTPPQFFISKLLFDLKMFWSIPTLTFLVIGLYLLLTMLIIAKIFVRKNQVTRWIHVLLFPITVLFLLLLIIFIVRIHENNTLHYAIVLVDKVDVLSSPEEEGTELFSLHEGIKFKVEEFRGVWAKVRLADGKVGWVKQEVFEII